MSKLLGSSFGNACLFLNLKAYQSSSDKPKFSIVFLGSLITLEYMLAKIKYFCWYKLLFPGYLCNKQKVEDRICLCFLNDVRLHKQAQYLCVSPPKYILGLLKCWVHHQGQGPAFHEISAYKITYFLKFEWVSGSHCFFLLMKKYSSKYLILPESYRT